eukprot:6705926-Alexandrium_andersonii.AAC.1
MARALSTVVRGTISGAGAAHPNSRPNSDGVGGMARRSSSKRSSGAGSSIWATSPTAGAGAGPAGGEGGGRPPHIWSANC